MDANVLVGLDIGGTKCAVSLGSSANGAISILDKQSFATPGSPAEALEKLIDTTAEMLKEHPGAAAKAAGISCGGPLDAARGRVLSPPNLPGWDDIDVVTPVSRALGIPCALQNDANACGLAEWYWGAGRGCRHMVFLTFGTGMGAGLILNGQLYSGASDMAGEVGHIRLEHDGPVGYGKAGSFEGFCSGGGIARLAKDAVQIALQNGQKPSFCPDAACLDKLTTRDVAEAAVAGDALAQGIFEQVAMQLGQGLSTIIDILNPECIVIGSIYLRQEALLRPRMMEVLQREALSHSRVSAVLCPQVWGNRWADYAALAVAMMV